MSTAIRTQLCQYCHTDQCKHAKPTRAVLTTQPGPVVDLLDLLEALPVVLRAARYERGLDALMDAAAAMEIDHGTLSRIERGLESPTTGSLLKILEWLGPLTRNEWDGLRYANVPPPTLSREELLVELRVVMGGKSGDRHQIAWMVGYSSADSLARRLWRMKENELAAYFQSDRHESPGPPSVGVTSPTMRNVLSHEDWRASAKSWAFVGKPS